MGGARDTVVIYAAACGYDAIHLDSNSTVSSLTIDTVDTSGIGPHHHGISWGPSTNVSVDNVCVHHVYGSGINCFLSTACEIKNCEVYECGKGGVGGSHGIYITDLSYNTVVDGCYCYNNGNCGIQVNGDNGNYVTGVVVKNNVLVNNQSWGGDLLNCQDCEWYNNLVISTSGGLMVGSDNTPLPATTIEFVIIRLCVLENQ